MNERGICGWTCQKPKGHSGPHDDIEAELAQATAEALAASAQVAYDHDEGAHDCKNWTRTELCGQVIAREIRALVPDIAAKAKEHDAKIRREAYLRCVDELDGDPNNLAHRFIETFRKWASEVDGGE